MRYALSPSAGSGQSPPARFGPPSQPCPNTKERIIVEFEDFLIRRIVRDQMSFGTHLFFLFILSFCFHVCSIKVCLLFVKIGSGVMITTGGQCAKPRAVLTKEQAINIFRISTFNYTKASRPTATSVAKAFGVSEKAIRDIWNGRTWCEETLPLDSSRQPKPRKKTGRPLGRKDSAPRRPKETTRQPGGSSRPAVSDDSLLAPRISRRKANSEDGASLLPMGATRLLPDHSLSKAQLLEYDSLPCSQFDKGLWNRDSIPISLHWHPFRHSASIDGSALSTARPWPYTTGCTRPSSCPVATSVAYWPAFENNVGFYAAMHANSQRLQHTCPNLSLALLPESAKAAPFDAPASLLSLDPALYAPHPPPLSPPPAAFWNLAAALPLRRAAQSARPSAADHADTNRAQWPLTITF